MPAPVAIVDRKRFMEYLDRAQSRTEALLADLPQWTAGTMILPQLEFIRGLVGEGRAATDEEKARINLGILAVREVEEMDAAFADCLEELDFAFRRFEELP